MMSLVYDVSCILCLLNMTPLVYDASRIRRFMHMMAFVYDVSCIWCILYMLSLHAVSVCAGWRAGTRDLIQFQRACRSAFMDSFALTFI